MKYVILYLLIINLIGFLMMYIDKQKAKKGKWRIKEISFLIVALLGGAIGNIIGMYTFSHKTKKWYFKYGFIIVLIMQILVVYNIYSLIK